MGTRGDLGDGHRMEPVPWPTCLIFHPSAPQLWAVQIRSRTSYGRDRRSHGHGRTTERTTRHRDSGRLARGIRSRKGPRHGIREMWGLVLRLATWHQLGIAHGSSIEKSCLQLSARTFFPATRLLL